MRAVIDSGASPLVSIVTPSLGQAEFIEDTILSVLGQDYPRVEYVVVDGGSDDGTLDILRRYEDRLRWTSGTDAGQSDAINRGFASTSGEIIAWLNADDVYTPGAIAAAVEAFSKDPALELVYGHAEYMDRAGRTLDRQPAAEPWDYEALIERTNLIQQPAAYFRRAAFDAVGGLDSNLHYVMDYDLWIRLGARGRVRFLPAVLAKVRVHSETKTLTGGIPRFTEMERMLGRHSKARVPTGFAPEMLRLLAREAAHSMRGGRVREAAGYMQRLLPYAAGGVARRGLRRSPNTKC